MCNPALGVMAVSVAMSAYSMHEQNKAQNAQAEAEMINATNAQIADQNALKDQAQQISDNARDVQLQRRREALRERSRMRVASAGATGNSIDRLFNTSYFNEAFDTSTITKNKENGLTQNLRELEKANTLAIGRYRNANANWISGSRANSRVLISGAQGGLQGYSLGKTMFG